MAAFNEGGAGLVLAEGLDGISTVIEKVVINEILAQANRISASLANRSRRYFQYHKCATRATRPRGARGGPGPPALAHGSAQPPRARGGRWSAGRRG